MEPVCLIRHYALALAMYALMAIVLKEKSLIIVVTDMGSTGVL
jgi:hypothetical protein